MKKSKLEIILDYLDNHPWQARIILTAIVISVIKTDLMIIINYFLNKL